MFPVLLEIMFRTAENIDIFQFIFLPDSVLDK